MGQSHKATIRYAKAQVAKWKNRKAAVAGNSSPQGQILQAEADRNLTHWQVQYDKRCSARDRRMEKNK